MKTILIFDQCGQSPLQFFAIDGDYARLNKVYINGASDTQAETDLQDELYDLLYTEQGKLKVDPYLNFPTNSVGLDTAVIVCGFCA